MNKRNLLLIISLLFLVGCSPPGLTERMDNNLRKFDTSNEVMETKIMCVMLKVA